MNSTRWPMVLGAILIANTATVLTTSFWRLAYADENSANALPEVQAGIVDNRVADANELPGAGDQKSTDATAESHFGSQLPSVELPEVSALDSEALQKDPVFQEFQEMFGAKSDEALLELPDTLLTARPEDTSSTNTTRLLPAEHSPGYYAALDARLESISRLIEGARSLTAEAASASNQNDRRQATKLLRMADQLRGMAADLLRD